MTQTRVTSKLTDAFILQLALGNISGYTSDFILGVQSDLDPADGNITIWDNKFDYTPFTEDTEMYLSSSNNADTQLVRVTGLDTNFDKLSVDTQLTGQTQTSIGIFRHVQSAIVLGPTTPAGDIYVAASDTLTAGVPDTNSKNKSKIIQGKNTTHNGFYWVPRGKTVVVPAIQASTDTATKHVAIQTVITHFGGLPMNVATYTAMAGFLQYTFPVPFNNMASLGSPDDVALGKAFIEFKGLTNSNDTQVFFSLDLIVVDSALAQLA